MMKTNCILVLNLALSDLLMGVYLLDLAVRNTTTSGRYERSFIRSGNKISVGVGSLGFDYRIVQIGHCVTKCSSSLRRFSLFKAVLPKRQSRRDGPRHSLLARV